MQPLLDDVNREVPHLDSAITPLLILGRYEVSYRRRVGLVSFSVCHQGDIPSRERNREHATCEGCVSGASNVTVVESTKETECPEEVSFGVVFAEKHLCCESGYLFELHSTTGHYVQEWRILSRDLVDSTIVLIWQKNNLYISFPEFAIMLM